MDHKDKSTNIDAEINIILDVLHRRIKNTSYKAVKNFLHNEMKLSVQDFDRYIRDAINETIRATAIKFLDEYFKNVDLNTVLIQMLKGTKWNYEPALRGDIQHALKDAFIEVIKSKVSLSLNTGD